jgi:hypothetical protein
MWKVRGGREGGSWRIFKNKRKEGKKERKLAEDYSNIENQMKTFQRSEITGTSIQYTMYVTS